MPDSKVEFKACPIKVVYERFKHMDKLLCDPLIRKQYNGENDPYHLTLFDLWDAIKEHQSTPIANNGVSVRGIIDTCAHVACDAVHHVGFLNMSQQKKGEYIAKQIRALHAKLPTTAINNGVSFDSIVDKLTHLNGDHLIGLELNDIHIIANFITRLQTTAPRGGNMIDVVKKAVESGAVVIKPCTANCLNGIITDHEGAEVRDIVCPTCSGREYVITEGEVSGG